MSKLEKLYMTSKVVLIKKVSVVYKNLETDINFQMNNHKSI